MLGGKDSPKRVPESKGYDRIFLGVKTNEREYTIERAFDGGAFRLHDISFESELDDSVGSKILKQTHSKRKTDTLSHFILDACGLTGHQVRNDAYGTTESLTIRTLINFLLVDETRIITLASPIVSGQRQDKTKELSIFGFLLSGRDDNAIVPEEKPKQKKQRLGVEANLLELLANDSRGRLDAVHSDPENLEAQFVKLESSIEEITSSLAATREEISNLETRRRDIVLERQKFIAKQKVDAQQIERFEILHQYYNTDQDRLEAMAETGGEFAGLPESECPICGELSSEKQSNSMGTTLSNFTDACRAESQKIEVLKSDLAATLKDLRRDSQETNSQVASLNGQFARVQSQIEELLSPQANQIQTDLLELVAKRNELVQAASIKNEVARIEEMRTATELAKKEKNTKPTFSEKVSVQSTTALCEEIRVLLVAWKYPDVGAVSYDPSQLDFVIGGRDRSSRGKGYRAIAFAAFTIALMRYCRKNEIAHPGFVVLDTPVNPYKGPGRHT